MLEVLVGGLIAGRFINNVMKSDDLEKQATRKNGKAFSAVADAQRKLQLHQEDMEKALTVNATRKMALLGCHLDMFRKTYDSIRKINFKKGRGVEEIEEMEMIQAQLTQYVSKPLLANGMDRADPQLVFSIIRHGGLSGQFVADSHEKLDVARMNLANANVVNAHADAICTAYDGIAERARMCTGLLQKLASVYIKSISYVKTLIINNGMDEEKYSEMDVAAINTCLLQTKLLYKIINTPLINTEGGLTDESMAIIDEGQRYLSEIS